MADITTTAIRVDFVSYDELHVLVCSNDIRENYVSELRKFKLWSPQNSDTLLRREEWLTSFYSPGPASSFVSRWDNLIYTISDGAVLSNKRPCEAITRVTGATDGRVFATCYGGLVQLFENDAWVSLNMKRDVDLFFALADGPSSFFVCGADSTFARWDNGTWAFIDLPTSADFFGLARSSDGDIVVCGDHALFKGHGDDWRSIDMPDATFHHARTAGSSIYLSAGEKGLFRLHNDQVVPFDTEVYAYHCDVGTNAVVCCGANAVHIIGGQGKTRVDLPDLF